MEKQHECPILSQSCNSSQNITQLNEMLTLRMS